MTTANCPDIDVLVALGAALDWEPEGTLAHVASCAACRAQVRELGELRHALTESVVPRPGFTEEVVRALPRERSGSAWGARLALALVASCTTAVALAVSSVGTSGDRMLVALPLISVLAGAAATAWLGRPDAEVAAA